ncbi:hypothetical protein [Tenacibaculum finnmarkense]|uniref:hypothetical protein n=1 Tax=Tenacibaculum finnmarkense TaxID=2781243 RepID=UPI000C798447|nr:hypothetical protein [Tenacibaculum finnmarkense]MCD8412754.1 hypothetical protein [Tenacibaculum finnmarkense genomovar ulcerans]SOU86396.1 hypothetical protein TDCHD05_130038 [Tenacibaculum dicentrarchi]
MKNTITVETRNNNNELMPKLFKIDETIIKGLYVTHTPFKVKKNIKKFSIVKQQAKSFKDVGVKYSKHEGFVIVTINLRAPNVNLYIQFLILKEVTSLSILHSEHPMLFGLKEVLINGCSLSGCNTLADLMNF